MTINKRNLTDKEIQDLIDKELERRRWNSLYLNAKIQQQVFDIYFNALKDAEIIEKEEKRIKHP